MVVVQGPGLYVVLGELGVRQQTHGVGHDLHISVGKLLQAQVHLADLATDTCGERFTCATGHLSIKGVIVDEVSAMKLLIMSLVHCDHIFFSSENLHL